nr:diadenylate cyclase [Pirellula staleyi]
MSNPALAEPIRLRGVARAVEVAYDAADLGVVATTTRQSPETATMKPHRFDELFSAYISLASLLCKANDASALMLMLSGPTDWKELRESVDKLRIVVVADTPQELAGAEDAGLATIVQNMADSPVIEKMTQALLTGVAREILTPGDGVVVVYSGFEADVLDSISFIRLDEHLGRLTARDLKQLETSVPLETLKTVVDLAVEIGREGREGKAVGTLFVVGDTRKVLQHCQPAGYDPVKGYTRPERDLDDPRVREAVKEIAVLDGAFIVSPEGIVEKSAQLVDAPYADLTLSKGLGARHWAGAAISKSTNAIAVVVSQSSGTVRIFQNGQVVLRIEPLRQAMKWKDFEYEPPPADE